MDDFVSVYIDRVDRGHADFKRLPGRIINEKIGKNLTTFTIGTAYGVLDKGYCGKDLQIYNGILAILPEKDSKKISLRQAAALASNHTVDLSIVTTSCNCNQTCQNNSCRCFKNKLKCTSHCHSKSRVKCCINVEK